MPAHTNFFETVKEANIRLRGTVVLYDKEPYSVLAITDHKKDGIFRIYLIPIGIETDKGGPANYPQLTPAPINTIGPDHPSFGSEMDKWLDANPKTKVIRKSMNSPLFDKYRPFPLGMCNYETNVVYIERQPTRKTEQGLTRQMLDTYLISVNKGSGGKGVPIDLFHPAFRACVVAQHPTPKECLAALLSNEFKNEALAFHRDFAFIKGPIDLIFMAYKGDIIGVLPKNNFDFLKLGVGYRHCREVVEGLRLFANIL